MKTSKDARSEATDAADAGTIANDAGYQAYANRGTYNPNIVWAQERSGAVMNGEEAHNFRMLHDPQYRAQHMYGVSLPQEEAHALMAANDPVYRDMYGEDPDHQAKIDAYADAYRRLTPAKAPAKPTQMTSAERAAYMADLAKEEEKARVALRGISPEEREWRQTQIDAQKGRLAQAARDAVSTVTPRKAQPVSDYTAEQIAMFDESLAPVKPAKAAAAPPPPPPPPEDSELRAFLRDRAMRRTGFTTR